MTDRDIHQDKFSNESDAPEFVSVPKSPTDRLLIRGEGFFRKKRKNQDSESRQPVEFPQQPFKTVLEEEGEFSVIKLPSESQIIDDQAFGHGTSILDDVLIFMEQFEPGEIQNSDEISEKLKSIFIQLKELFEKFDDRATDLVEGERMFSLHPAFSSKNEGLYVTRDVNTNRVYSEGVSLNHIVNTSNARRSVLVDIASRSPSLAPFSCKVEIRDTSQFGTGEINERQMIITLHLKLSDHPEYFIDLWNKKEGEEYGITETIRNGSSKAFSARASYKNYSHPA